MEHRCEKMPSLCSKVLEAERLTFIKEQCFIARSSFLWDYHASSVVNTAGQGRCIYLLQSERGVALLKGFWWC